MNRNHEKRSNLKDEILTVAQSMFRDYGYDDTTFQKIADQLGITKGAITYHFKNKHLIMAHFFDRYFQTLRDFIDSYPDDYRNTYWRYCVMYIYAYRTIMKNPRNQSLFFHQDQMSLWESSKVPTVVEIYRAIAKNFTPAVKPGGYLAFEFGLGQEDAVCWILEAWDYDILELKRDGGGIVRAVLAQRKERD